MWLSLVRQLCLECRIKEPSRMRSEAEHVKLLEAAMKSSAPEAYLAGMQETFEGASRDDGAMMAASLQSLRRADEIEMLTSMRAEWPGLRSLSQPPSALSF